MRLVPDAFGSRKHSVPDAFASQYVRFPIRSVPDAFDYCKRLLNLMIMSMDSDEFDSGLPRYLDQ